MSLQALRRAAEMEGSRLSGPGGELVLVERIRAHGLPTLVVLGREATHVTDALDAWARSDAPINLTALLSLPQTDLAEALAAQRRRIGAVTAALDASLPWLNHKPMLAKRLPGRIAGEIPLEPAPMGPMEAAELADFLKGWTQERIRDTFILPTSPRSETSIWPDVSVPEGADILVHPFRLAVGDALMDALRRALRRSLERPIPLLPLPENPVGLHALRLLSQHVAAFRGPASAWGLALEAIARLPAPPHFCARC